VSPASFTEEQYLGQHKYYSESQHQFVDVSSMAPPYARNAMQKLHREFGDAFHSTALWLEFMRYLKPDRDEVLQRLKRTGTCTIWATDYNAKSRARRVMYRAGKKLGVKVTTQHKNGFITGTTVTPPLAVRVRGQEIG
jgi:hypothetical protein